MGPAGDHGAARPLVGAGLCEARRGCPADHPSPHHPWPLPRPQHQCACGIAPHTILMIEIESYDRVNSALRFEASTRLCASLPTSEQLGRTKWILTLFKRAGGRPASGRCGGAGAVRGREAPPVHCMRAHCQPLHPLSRRADHWRAPPLADCITRMKIIGDPKESLAVFCFLPCQRFCYASIRHAVLATECWRCLLFFWALPMHYCTVCAHACIAPCLIHRRPVQDWTALQR